MSLDDYALVQRDLGTSVLKAGRVYWQRVRRCFCRPLLPYRALEPLERESRPPGWAGFQHVARELRNANSTTSFLMLDQLQDYALEKVSHNRRRLIKNAAKRFEIRPARNLAELETSGFAAYLSFYERTRYGYFSERRRQAVFCRWAASVLRQPKTFVLGAYGPDGLVAVSISYWVEETLIYATFFSDSAALREGAGELMFHALRETAAQTSGVEQVFVRPYQGGNGMDQYYLLRGAKLVRKPATLQLHPAISWALKLFRPGQLKRLQGNACLA